MTTRLPALALLLVAAAAALVLVACSRTTSQAVSSGAALAQLPTAAATETIAPSPSAAPSATPVPPTPSVTPTPTPTLTPTPTPTYTPTPTREHPLMIETMRRQAYPGSDLVIEQRLEPGDNYDRYIASYESGRNTIYGLLTIPWGQTPDTGWPVILFNHGWIRPEDYRTTERYLEYVDYIARSGYILFRSDYRGHGESEGRAGSIYTEPNYTVDVLNALAAVKTLPEVDPDRIGMWGHSMGGHITLRAMVVNPEIKAGVIWAGVVGRYPDIFSTVPIRATVAAATAEAQGFDPPPTPRARNWLARTFAFYGTPETNPAFYDAISANTFLRDLGGPLQLHHAVTDDVVPVTTSIELQSQMEALGLHSELYLYENDSHDIDNNFYTAMRHSVEFFDAHVKNR